MSIDIYQIALGAPLPGGNFAGIVYDKKTPHALVLGPEYDGELSFYEAIEWARSIATINGVSDFVMPPRIALDLCDAYLPHFFRSAWYWSGDKYVLPDIEETLSAWGRDFLSHYDTTHAAASKCRARAVRLISISYDLERSIADYLAALMANKSQ